MWKGGIRSTVYDDEEGEEQIDFSLMEMDLGTHIGQASGEGVPVVLSQHQVDGYRMSSHARLILDGEEPYIKAGFLDDFKPNYEPSIEGSSFELHMLAMEAYAEGEPCDELIIRAYLAPPPRVVFESPAQPEASLVNILEKTALRHIEGDLCLLNPSMGTVWRAIDEGKYFSVAYTEGSQNDENRKRFESTFSELIRDQKNEYIPKLKKEQVFPDVHYFCGMSGVHNWVVNGSGFDPNIFDPQFIAASVTSMEEYSDGVHLRHWRKDYETIRDWVYHPHYYRYSASGFMARMGRDYKDSNYYQNELTSYLDRFFYCSTRVLPSVSIPFSPTPCGKVFFPVTQPIRVWWEGDQCYPMYHYVESGIRYLVWVDMGYSYYSSRCYLQNVSATLSLALWNVTSVPNSEFVMYPLSSTPSVIAVATAQPYVMREGDRVLYRSNKCELQVGYECERCGVWQVGEQQLPICYQCQCIGQELLIGLGVDVDPAYIALANRSPGTVVRMDTLGICIIVLRDKIPLPDAEQPRPPDLIIQDIPYKFNQDGSVAQLSAGIEQGNVSYVFWGKICDYPGRKWTLRYGDWARYPVYVYCGRAVWFRRGRFSSEKEIRRKIKKISQRNASFQYRVRWLVDTDNNTQLKALRKRISSNERKIECLLSSLEGGDEGDYIASALSDRMGTNYIPAAFVDPAPRLLIRRMMADWHDTTMQLTLAVVPLIEWIASIMPRTLSSAKGIDDGISGVVLEECEWL